MYTNFFSLSELPFSIAPNPKYLFMSDRHREALTHLSHGLGGTGSGDNGGFVLLTGEVGTGKTTVSRCLMEDLPENTQLAFILNPTLSSQELLATICDQLKIRYRKTGATTKTLTDKISGKLLKNHENGINTVLIIDEAQHLEAQVLEQLRLLTNLETNTKKLLQVILIGQPELQQLLKRRDLRQLAQRITARYHLLPLNKVELASYIKHRLAVADCHRALFNKGAISAIHKLSQGIPRLINLLCHSALMQAYNSNNAVVDKKIVLQAASHALGDDFDYIPWWQQKNSQISVAAIGLIAVLVAGFWLGQTQQTDLLDNTSLAAEPNHALPQSVIQTLPQTAEKSAATPPSELVTNPLDKTQPSQAVQVPIEQMVISAEKLAQSPVITQVEAQKAKTKPEPKVAQKVKPKPAKKVEAEPEPKVTPPAKVVKKAQPKPQPTVDYDNYQVEAVDGVSDDLLARFQAAIEDTEGKKTIVKPKKQLGKESDIKSLTQMPAWVQEGVPRLHFEQHIYSSDGEGWVNVNGRDRYEGDNIANGLIIDKILPQQVILTYRGEKFSLPALTNW